MGDRGLVCFHGKNARRTATLKHFAEHLGRLSKTREDVKTLFELGELDDYVSFGGKA